MTMRVDMHVHSMYSEPSTEWFMERWGIAESYSDPVSIYEKARRAGMSRVTLTDHNSVEGSLILKERFGDRVFTGVECTAAFPEDNCKVHVLVYGLDEKQFGEIQRLRKDIYELRDYLREEGLVHSVAHATFSVQPGKLTVAHLEKLLILFDVFEVINGGRPRSDNAAWHHILEALTPDHLEGLCRKHALEPFDSQPWIKGVTGGSDDHGGIFIGRSYTEGTGATTEEFLSGLGRKQTSAEGRHSDYQTFAFSVYKVLHDRGRRIEKSPSASLLMQLADALFEKKRVSLANRFRIRRLKARAKKGEDEVISSFHRLADTLSRQKHASLEEAISLVCAGVGNLSDGFLRLLFNTLGRDMAKLDLYAMTRSVQASMPGILLLLPFLMALRHLNGNRDLVDRLASTLRIEKARGGTRVLWFTDTLNDLNGVSVTLGEVSRLTYEKGLDVKIVTATDAANLVGMTPNILNLPFIHEFNLPYYESYRLRVPSVLTSLKEMYSFDPDRIHISTPGPVGLLGLLVARMMNVKSVGFYHTDFALQAREIVEDQSVSGILETFTRWFYSAMDEIRVPTLKYAGILEARGFDPRKMSTFARGIDLDRFKPQAPRGHSFLAERFGIPWGTTLLYVGRISKDKDLDFLMESYALVAADRIGVNLLVIGDGPYLAELRKRSNSPRVVFAGRMDHSELPAVYSASDLFVFPSTTDTFGKVVLEAQACGLPALVSDIGGPQEIVLQGKTGFVAKAGSILDWTGRIENVLDIMVEAPSLYHKMREEARSHAVERYDWEDIIGSIFDTCDTPDRGVEKKIA